MGKPAFFLRFYKSQKMRFAVLVFIFAFAGAILSCSLLVQSNNKAYARAQAKTGTVSCLTMLGLKMTWIGNWIMNFPCLT